MGLSVFLGQELAGALENVLCAQLAPAQQGGITGVKDLGGLAVNGQGHGLIIISDGAVKLAVNSVILDGVSQLACGFAGSIDGNDLYVIRLDSCSVSQGANTAKAIDTNFNHG